jgi:hypothetical protein
MPESPLPEEAKRLISLCRAGKLYEAEKWIAAGNSVETSKDFKKTPLYVTLDLGFPSLVELLVRQATKKEAKEGCGRGQGADDQARHPTE